MNSKSLIAKILFTVLFVLAAIPFSNAQNGPRRHNEVFVLRSMRIIHSAEATYNATYGNGNYGSLQNLYQAGFIDEALASGSKYGYTYVLTTTPWSPGPPSTGPRFTLTATPRAYRKSGINSFFINEYGVIRGADRGGQPATVNDPYIDFDLCTNGGIADNERCTREDIRAVHGAEFTYSATTGNGNFGTLEQLRADYLISNRLSTGLTRGYRYTVTFVNGTQKNPAALRISAVPQIYGVTGIRSFFMATDGVLRGADKQGAPADENDPEVDVCAGSGTGCNENAAISSLRTLHGAETTYYATYGDGIRYGTLAQLAKAAFISQGLGDGIHFGYSFTITTTVQTSTTPATFAISAVPITYGVTGVRSFFIATEGVIRAADRNGGPANEDDPPISN